MKKIFFIFVSIIFSLPSAVSAQEICKGVEESEAPKISALYVDNYADWHSVRAQNWLSFGFKDQSVFNLCSVNNDKNYLIAQNSITNNYNPTKFSRFEWYIKEDQLYYCQQVFDAKSPADAASFKTYPAANTAQPNVNGCGKKDFPWSILILIRK